LQWTEALYAPSDSTFSYQDGKLKVDRGGRYYIYAQVTFCVKSEPHEPFTVYMYLHLPSERDQLLLKGMRTPGSTDNVCSLQSVHLGRVVELQQGHTVFINVTNSSRVNYDHGNTYFGMFEISEKSP
ncbi:PREDICTED: CD40 ligand-like, partial [Gekko japonicus]